MLVLFRSSIFIISRNNQTFPPKSGGTYFHDPPLSALLARIYPIAPGGRAAPCRAPRQSLGARITTEYPS